LNLKSFIWLILMLLLLAGCTTTPQVIEPEPTLTPQAVEPVSSPALGEEREGWTLVWQEAFDGESIDAENWKFDIGGSGWGNNEWQFYTDRPENVRLENEMLVIEAREEKFVSRNYTSGRIKTQDLRAFTYGRIEARMKLPYGPGIWPAFWMLGDDIATTPWPRCGEIDIMEHIGRQPTHVYGTVHGPGYSGSGGVGHYKTFPSGVLSDEFHVFAIEWEPEEIRWYVDDEQFFQLTPKSVPGDWVYDHPFFIIINLAVGGNWPGYPDESTVFPQYLMVDYVRVYQRPDNIAVQSSRGSMRIGDIEVEAQDAETGWQGKATIRIVDQAGQPVSGARVTGGWVGIVVRGETTAETNADGMVQLLSNPTERQGELTYCVTGVTAAGYTYDKAANERNCAKVEK
jgi:beta-glucanase (GH16 family)